MMYYALVAPIYLYILIRLFLLTRFNDSNYNNNAVVSTIKNILLSTKTFLIELVVFGFALNYVFGHMYAQIDKKTSLIVPNEFILTTFYTLIFFIGFAIAIKFTLHLTQQVIHSHQSVLFVSNMRYYHKIADILIHSGMFNIFMLYSILELSYPTQEANVAFLVLLSILSFLISIVYRTHYRNMEKEVQRIILITHLFLSGLVVLMINESNHNNIASIPLTTSILIFHSIFLIEMIIEKSNIISFNLRDIVLVLRKKQDAKIQLYGNTFQATYGIEQNQVFIPHHYKIDQDKVYYEKTIPIKVIRSNSIISLKQIVNQSSVS